MNLVNILLDKSGLPENSFSLGGALGLWDIARNKISKMPIYVIFLKQAKDKDLQKFINTRITKVQKQVTNIQKIFKEKDFDYPSELNLEIKLKDNSAFVISSSILDDEEISIASRELMRGIISLETEALRNAIDAEARDLIYNMLHEDNEVYNSLLRLQKEKNWVTLTPAILPQ